MFFSNDLVKDQITHDNIMDSMKMNEQLSRDAVSLRSKDHVLRTIKNPQIVRNRFHDKMQLINVIGCEPSGYKH